MANYRTCKECGRQFEGNGFLNEYCCEGCYDRAKQREREKNKFDCPVCGKLVTAGGYSMGDPRLSGMKKFMSSKSFCSETCGEQYWSTHVSSAKKKLDKKTEKENIKAQEKKEKRLKNLRLQRLLVRKALRK